MMDDIYIDNFFEDSARTSIFIGENGSGKSRLLNKLAKRYLSSGHKVVAIVNSIHDQFTPRSSQFHFLGARSGRNISKNTIKKAIENISNENMVQLKNISQILSYVGYSSAIGIHVKGLNKLDRYILQESENLSEEEMYDIESLVSKYFNLGPRYGDYKDDILWLEFDDFSFDKVNRSLFSRFIALESKLRRLGVLKSIDIFLRKNEQEIALNRASSGELSFITSMIYLSSVVDDRTIVLIDEPENSLHPSWQKEYLGKILDLFPYYQTNFVIATHSPLIVSGAENTDDSVTVYKSESGKFSRLDHKSNDLESMLWSMFGVITPESRYLSNYFVSALNDLGEDKTTIDEVLAKIESVENISYSRKQIDTISGVRDLALKIEFRKDKL
jgi:predicted ATPase